MLSDTLDSFCGNEASDFVKIHHDRTLLEATKLIHNFGARDTPFAVHVFRRAIPSLGAEEATMQLRMVLGRVRLKKLRLTPSAVPGLLVNRKSEGDFSGDLGSKLSAMKEPPSVDLNLTCFSGIEAAYSRILVSNVGEHSSVYGMNLPRVSALVPTYLTKLPLHIDLDRNSDFGCSFGINQPSFYAAGYASFSEMHPEDGYLDSVNVMHWGIGEQTAKLWLCVHPGDFWRLCGRVAREIPIVKEQDPTLKPLWDTGCCAPLHHKNLVLTPELLCRWAVRYEIIVQRPGDMVYVGPAVYHQVVNIGVSFAEAVNVGGHLWNSAGNKYVNCQCADTAISFVPPCATVTSIVRVKLRVLYSCPVVGCPSSFTTEAQALVHRQVHEPASATSSASEVCQQCRKVLRSRTALARHVREQHEGARRARVACEVCGVTMLTQSLRRHRSRYHAGGVE